MWSSFITNVKDFFKSTRKNTCVMPEESIVAEATAEPVVPSMVVVVPSMVVVSESVAEPVVPSMVVVSEPVSESVAEPVSESVAEPVLESVSEPVAEPVSEPVSEPVAEPVSEPVEEPLDEHAVREDLVRLLVPGSNETVYDTDLPAIKEEEVFEPRS